MTDLMVPVYREWVEGAGGRAMSIRWRDSAGDLLDFSGVWNFTMLVRKPGEASYRIDTTSGFTGYNPSTNTNPLTDPNLVWQPPNNTVESLEAGEYRAEIRAIQGAMIAPLVKRVDIVIGKPA